MIKKKSAFTLVEMLIVVVIIGILAAALIPRLTGAQARARDAARKGHLNQLSTALASYFNDKGTYVTGNCATALTGLIGPYINSIPTDPQGGRTTYGTDANGCSQGIYGYKNMKRNGATDAGMVILANTETEGMSSNYVLNGGTSGTTPTSRISFSGTAEATDLENKICSKGVTIKDAYKQCNSKNGENVGGVNNINDRMVYVVFQ